MVVEITLVNHKPLTPPDGGTVRIERILSGLRREGREVSFAHWEDASPDCAATDSIAVAKPRLGPVRRLANRLYGGEEGSAALDLILCNYPSMFAKIRGELRTSAILQTEQIWSALLPLMYRKSLNKVSVLDDHNVEAVLAMRLMPYVGNQSVYREWVRYVSVLEGLCCRLADVVVVTSELDMANLERTHGVSRNKVRVIPNGTDVDRYRPDPALASATRKRLGIPEGSPVLAFVGRFTYPPNRLAIDYIKSTLAPTLWRTHPDARFLIVSRHLPKGYLDEENGRLIEVKDDADQGYINAADVCLAPLAVGSGTRIKIANYMACGKPVVSTPIGCEGISTTDGRELVVSELEEFPAHVISLLENSQTRSELGANARDFAEKFCRWERSVEAFQDLYEHLHTSNGN